MKITNNHNIPGAIYDVIAGKNYDITKTSTDSISVTTLIDSPRIAQLKRRHWAEIEEDASDRLWALLGDAVHAVLEKAKRPDALMEESLSVEIDGMKLRGRVDMYENGIVKDYKITSVWSFILNGKNSVKVEWERQLNAYAYLYRKSGFDVKGLEINAILRDWKDRDAKDNADYPKIPFISVKIPLWTLEQQEHYLSSRICAHKSAQTEDASRLPLCTAEERWQKPDKWAIYKNSNVRALRVFDKEDDAIDYATSYAHDNPKERIRIEKRPGEDTRCLNYCNVRRFCDHYKTITKEESNG